MKRVIYLILTCLVFAGCEPTLIAEFEDKPVVSCFLDAGTSPVLTVSKLIAFRDDVAYSNQDVNMLSITIRDETADQDYQLQSTGEGKYENPSLIAQTGHTYYLSFVYENKPVSATTTVPQAPREVDFSAASIGIMVFDGFSASLSRAQSGREIEITWSNDDRNYYIIEGYTKSTNPVRESDTELSKSFKLDYTQGSTATLSQAQFNYFGSYEVSLIRILPEYVIMSQGSVNSSTNLVDIKGNIDGGYGIFTGVNRVVKTINIYQESSPF